jgi:hypothetical protein
VLAEPTLGEGVVGLADPQRLAQQRFEAHGFEEAALQQLVAVLLQGRAPRGLVGVAA